MNASRPSEHPQSGGKCQKRLGGIIGCKDTSLYDPQLLRLFNFQVNTLVGLFWIMLKISTWLVVFFAPPQIISTQSAPSLLKLYTLHIVYYL